MLEIYTIYMKLLNSRATTQTLGIIGFVFLIQLITQYVMGGLSTFTLVYPLTQDPLSVVLSIYSHNGFGHIISNVIALALFGYLVESVTTRKRFHVFFILTGIIAGIAEITFWLLFNGTAIQVLGASGAIFGLMGYALTGNDLSKSVIEVFDLSDVQIIGLFVLLASVITFMTGGPGVALVAHATGLVIGLISGHYKLLHT